MARARWPGGPVARGPRAREQGARPRSAGGHHERWFWPVPVIVAPCSLAMAEQRLRFLTTIVQRIGPRRAREQKGRQLGRAIIPGHRATGHISPLLTTTRPRAILAGPELSPDWSKAPKALKPPKSPSKGPVD